MNRSDTQIDVEGKQRPVDTHKEAPIWQASIVSSHFHKTI